MRFESSQTDDVEVEPQAPLATAPSRLRTCTVDLPDSLPSGADIFAQVSLGGSGEVLWSVEGDAPTVPASVLKLVTARAALAVLGPDYRFVTRIYEGVSPGELWLVGGGDPTLSRTLLGSTTYYTDPPRVEELARQVGDYQERTGVMVTSLGVDTSHFDAYPQWNDTWRINSAQLGFVTPVTSFMADGGRQNPAGRLSPRVTDPVSQATSALVQAIGEETGSWGIELTSGSAPSATRVVAEVSSQPVSVLIDQMIRDSDNQIAEALLREVAVVSSVGTLDAAARLGLPESFADSEDFFAEDGSGLSQNNRVSPEMVTALLQTLVTEESGEPIVSSLAIPGEPGSLLRREASFGEASDDVAAKTGSLVGVRSLAGVIDGPEPLVFSVFVVGQRVGDTTRDDIDFLVSEFHRCGENLAHLVPTGSGG